jgi:MtrB/PioB family decaheme-associated outer membrane protein
MRVHHHFPLTTLAAAVLAVCAQAALAAEDESIEQYSRPDSSITVGVGYWTDPRPHEGMYDGMWDSGFYGSLDASLIRRDDATGTWTTLTADNLGLDTYEIGASYEKQGNWGVELQYSQIPRQNPYEINSGLQGIGTETQTITPVVPGNGNNKALEVERGLATLSMFKRFSPELEFRATYKNEQKSGDRQWGWAILITASQRLPGFRGGTIDSTTQQLTCWSTTTSASCSDHGYYGSWYGNDNNYLEVIGAPTGTNSPGYTDMSLPPDNQAHQGYLQGNYAFTPTTLGTFKVAYTHAKQNQAFMPTNGNGVASWQPLPTVGNSLNGEVNTTEALLGLTARPMENLSLLASLRYWDKQDETPVRVDAQSSSGSTLYHNNPFSETVYTGKLEGTYRLQGGFNITAGVDYAHEDREISSLIVPTTELFVPYRKELDQTTFRLDLRRSLSEQLNGSIGYSYSTRDGSNYIPVNTSVDSATITPFYIADRDRDTWKLGLDWTPMDRMGLQFNYSYSQDEYPTDGVRIDGIRKGTAQMFSIDGDYALNDQWKARGWYTHDTNKIDQEGPLAPAPNTWFADLDNKGDTVGLGLDGQATDKINVGASYEWVRTVSTYDQTGLAAGVEPLPDINTYLTRVGLFGTYDLMKNGSIRVDLIHEIWKTNDWTWTFQDGSPFSYATEGTQVTQDYDQPSTFYGVSYSYKF